MESNVQTKSMIISAHSYSSIGRGESPISNGIPGHRLRSAFRWICAQISVNREGRERRRRFDSILATNHPMIKRIAFSYANSMQDYEDLCQDILLNIWKGIGEFREEAMVSTWIYRIALNTCVSTIRRRNREPDKVELSEMVAQVADNTENYSMNEELMELHQAISELGPIDKAVITMRLDERSYDEIAEVTGLSKSNVGVRLNRIKHHLAERLKTPE